MNTVRRISKGNRVVKQEDVEEALKHAEADEGKLSGEQSSIELSSDPDFNRLFDNCTSPDQKLVLFNDVFYKFLIIQYQKNVLRDLNKVLIL